MILRIISVYIIDPLKCFKANNECLTVFYYYLVKCLWVRNYFIITRRFALQ